MSKTPESKTYYLEISEDYKLNLKDYEKEGIRIFVNGISGSGKSNSAKVFCEEILKINIPIIILDPEGEYASLREKSESMIVIGGKYADIPLNEYVIEDVIDLLYESGVSLIFDTSELFEQQQIDFSAQAMQILFHKATKFRKPIFLIVEECSLLAPEKLNIKSTKYAKEIISKGRKRGIHSIWISQRTAFVSKDIISQCNIRIIGKLIENNDINHIKDILKNANLSKIDIMNLTQEFFLITKEFKDKIKFKKATIRDLSQTPLFEEEITLITKKNKTLETLLIDLVKKAESKQQKELDETDYTQKLEGQIEKLNQNLTDKTDMISRLNHDLDIVSKLKVNFPQEAPKVQVTELTGNLQEKETIIMSLQDENKSLKQQDELRSKLIEELEQTTQTLSRDLNEKSIIVTNMTEIKTLVFKLSKIFSFSTEDNSFYEKKIKKLETVITELQELNKFDLINFENKIEFISHPEVKKAIDQAIGKAGETIIRNIITFIIQEDRPVTYKEVMKAYGYKSTSFISSGATALEKFLIIKKLDGGNGMEIDLNLESLPKIIMENQKQKALKAKSKELFTKKRK